MVLMKKLTLAVFVSIAMLAAAPSAMAKPAGKIANATPAETVIAIDETIIIAEETLQAIKDGALRNDVMALFKKTKQKAKTIESTVTYSIREKALGRLGKARLAYKREKDLTDIIIMTTKAVDTFKALKDRYHNFDGSMN